MKKIYAAAIAVPLILAGGAVKMIDLPFPREVQIAGDEPRRAKNISVSFSKTFDFDL